MTKKHDDQALLDFARELFDETGWPEDVRFDKSCSMIMGVKTVVKRENLNVELGVAFTARYIRDYLREKLLQHEDIYNIIVFDDGWATVEFHHNLPDCDSGKSTIHRKTEIEALIKAGTVVFMGGE